MKKLISVTLALVMILTCLSGLCFAAEAEARWTKGETSVEGRLSEMVKEAAHSGGTITLLKDIEIFDEKANAVSSAVSLTLDLNGHTIKTKAVAISITAKATGMTVIKNGTIISEKMNVWVKGGGLQMDGVTAWSDTQQNVSYDDTTGKWNDQNLIENCTFGNPAWGGFSFNNTASSMAGTVMAFKNTTIVANKKTQGIVIQSKAITANAVLGEGMKFYSLHTADTAYAASTISVTGEEVTKAEGTHSVTVADKTFDGMTMWTTPETATKAMEIPNLAGATEVVASWTDGKTTKEGTLLEVENLATTKGGTIKLLKDVNHEKESPAITSNTSFTLDLNGHTLTTKKIAVSVTNKAKGTTVITDSVGGGAIISGDQNIYVRTGALQVKGVTLWADVAQNIDYYETTDKFNHENIIEDSVIGGTAWCAFAFNNSKANQEKASMTIKNSTLLRAQEKGSYVIDLKNTPEGSTANVVLGEGVKLYRYGGKGVTGDALNVLGEALTKTNDAASVTILDKTFDMLVEWSTPETGTVDLATVIPGTAPVKPAEPEKPAEPAKPAEDKKDEDKKEPAKDEKPAEPAKDEGGVNVGVIIGIVAAIVVVAAVVVVVLKKKKK